MLSNFLKIFFYYYDLRKLAKLQIVLFSSYFSQINNEKKIHQQRIRVAKVIQKRLELMPIVDIIFSLNQLRHRVTDVSIYEICARELKEIEKTSINFLLKGELFSEIFLKKIHEFEAIYNNTLRVVAPDPMIFLFFIQDLYAFHEQVEQLYDQKTH